MAQSKKKSLRSTDSPRTSTFKDMSDVGDEVEDESNDMNEQVKDPLTSPTYITEDKIQDMFNSLQAGLLLTLREELDKRDRMSEKTTQIKMTREPEDIDEASTDDENRSSASSKKSTIPSSKIVQTIYDAIPKYDGEGDVQ